MMEINDININIKAGRSDTADGGNVLLESGSSSSSNTGTISIASKLSESGGESGIVSLKSGDSTSSNTGSVRINLVHPQVGKSGDIDSIWCKC